MNVDDWSIVVAGSLSLVGLSNGTKLSPVYVMSVTASQAGGNMQIHRVCFPMLMYSSIDEVELPPGSIVIPVSTLLEGERRELAERVEAAEKMKTSLRAAASRIQIAQNVAER